MARPRRREDVDSPIEAHLPPSAGGTVQLTRVRTLWVEGGMSRMVSERYRRPRHIRFRRPCNRITTAPPKTWRPRAVIGTVGSHHRSSPRWSDET